MNYAWDTRVVRLGLVLGSLVLGACFDVSDVDTPDGSSDSSGNPGPMVCISGETQECLCPGQTMGVQACNSEGTGYDPCDCSGATNNDDTTGGSTDEPGTDTGEDETTAGEDESTGGGPGGDCDPYAQDCPAGEKCAPWADDGGNIWNANRCVPIADDPATLGERCTLEEHSNSGLDDCDIGLVCTFNRPPSLEGLCIPLCGGDEASPTCPTGEQSCAVVNAVAPICLDGCHPLLQDCPDSQSCAGQSFWCVPHDSPGGEMGDPCNHVSDCGPGLFCLPEVNTPLCDGSDCCMPFCDTTMPECPAGLGCVSLFPPGKVPDFDDVGICV